MLSTEDREESGAALMAPPDAGTAGLSDLVTMLLEDHRKREKDLAEETMRREAETARHEREIWEKMTMIKSLVESLRPPASESGTAAEDDVHGQVSANEIHRSGHRRLPYYARACYDRPSDRPFSLGHSASTAVVQTCPASLCRPQRGQCWQLQGSEDAHSAPIRYWRRNLQAKVQSSKEERDRSIC